MRAAVFLERGLGDAANLSMLQQDIKNLEHQGDELTYEIVSTLNRTFVTPFDHEDIYALAAGLDDILDYVEEISDTTNLYGITTIPEPARELARLLVQAVAQLEQAVGKLESRKGAKSIAPRYTALRTSATQPHVTLSQNSSAVSSHRSRSSSGPRGRAHRRLAWSLITTLWVNSYDIRCSMALSIVTLDEYSDERILATLW